MWWGFEIWAARVMRCPRLWRRPLCRVDGVTAFVKAWRALGGDPGGSPQGGGGDRREWWLSRGAQGWEDSCRRSERAVPPLSVQAAPFLLPTSQASAILSIFLGGRDGEGACDIEIFQRFFHPVLATHAFLRTLLLLLQF